MRTESLELKKIIEKVKHGVWQLPGFQREYVWSPVQISKFVTSIFLNRPAGVITSWAQPDRNPHTTPARFSIGKKQVSFGDSGIINSVDSGISLIIDGRQRITSLLHVFEEFRPDKADKLAIKWFVNLGMNVGEGGFVFYERESALSGKGLDSTANALKGGFFPLSRLLSMDDLNLIFDLDIYDPNDTPTKELIKKRKAVVDELYSTFLEFKMPVIEVSTDVDLNDVCEIFDTLNQTGTTLSTFDLIHNKVFSAGYDLRNSYRNVVSQGSLSSVFGELPKETYAHLVTSFAILNPRSPDPVSDIKATSMLNLKKSDFEMFDDWHAQPVLEEAVTSLWSVFGGRFPGRRAPYPVTLTVYFALWLHHQSSEARERLAVLYRAYFVRSAFEKRFTEGQINKHANDLKHLSKLLLMNQGAPLNEWIEAVTPDFNSSFPCVDDQKLREMLLDASPDAGAPFKLIDTFLLARQTHDLLTAVKFEDLKADNPVEIHHFFPKKFLSNSKASFPNAAEQVDCFANRVPLSRSSNNQWKAKDPATILTEQKLDWALREAVFLQAGISKESFDVFGPVDPSLGVPKSPLTEADILSVWERRAGVIADRIIAASQLNVP
jgi:hypothetical protein